MATESLQVAAESPTCSLLIRWHQGDPKALDELVRRHLPWLTTHVQQELGPLLRAKSDVADVVQQALLEFLKYAPRFVLQGEAQLRGLLARIVRNVLADQDDFFRARRRSRALERPLCSDSMISLDPKREAAASPSQIAQRNDEEEWVRLAMELLEPQERDLLVLREWDRASFAEVGAKLGIGEAAARMRHHRAVLRLATVVVKLKSGDVDAALEASNA